MAILNNENIYILSGKINEGLEGNLGAIFSVLYEGDYSYSYVLLYKDKKLINYPIEDNPDFRRNIDTIDFDQSETLKKFKADGGVICYALSDFEYYVIGNDQVKFIMLLNCSYHHCRTPMIKLFTNDIDGFLEKYSDHFVKLKKDTENESEFGICTLNDGSLYTNFYDMKTKYKVDIKKNYNDDLPYDQLCKLIKDDSKADLILMYGEPGTGKSSLIKHLITKFYDKSFIFLDASILSHVQPAAFITYLTENEGSVFILEDCEKILESREFSQSSVMSIILNITDGVISDILGIKLICTFNTRLSNIDKALLRKGRLSLKYEFGKLALEKCKAINPNITKPTALSDLFNEEENDFSKEVKTKIGF